MRYIHIYLSPHLDDAILSCGGRIWQQTRAGELVQVVTIFAGAPAADVPLSLFAEELHTRWGHLADAVARRREEDIAALALLGAEAIHWPYADCIYRQTPDGHFPYASEKALWGSVHPGESGLVTELAARITELLASWDDADALKPTLYVPLGVGNHIDHQIVRRAASDVPASAVPGHRMPCSNRSEPRLRGDALETRAVSKARFSGHGVVYYEDYPYAQDPQAVKAVLELDRGLGKTEWRAELVPLIEAALRVKIAAIACYHSQLSTFWTSPTEMTMAIRAFAEQTGSGGPAERYWTHTPS